MQTYQEIDPKIKNHRSLLAALHTHPWENALSMA
jgi:hypothetical protein